MNAVDDNSVGSVVVSWFDNASKDWAQSSSANSRWN